MNIHMLRERVLASLKRPIEAGDFERMGQFKRMVAEESSDCWVAESRAKCQQQGAEAVVLAELCDAGECRDSCAGLPNWPAPVAVDALAADAKPAPVAADAAPAATAASGAKTVAPGPGGGGNSRGSGAATVERTREVVAPWFVFLAGPPGADKSTVVEQLIHHIEDNQKCPMEPKLQTCIPKCTSYLPWLQGKLQRVSGVWHDVILLGR